MSVASVDYQTSGGKDGNKNLIVTLTVLSGGNPVAGASVSITLSVSGGPSWNGSGTTGSNGNVSFNLNNAPSGTYTTLVTNVTASGFTWDGATPPNSFTK